jgi:hypothetical protein
VSFDPQADARTSSATVMAKAVMNLRGDSIHPTVHHAARRPCGRLAVVESLPYIRPW